MYCNLVPTGPASICYFHVVLFLIGHYHRMCKAQMWNRISSSSEKEMTCCSWKFSNWILTSCQPHPRVISVCGKLTVKTVSSKGEHTIPHRGRGTGRVRRLCLALTGFVLISTVQLNADKITEEGYASTGLSMYAPVPWRLCPIVPSVPLCPASHCAPRPCPSRP